MSGAGRFLGSVALQRGTTSFGYLHRVAIRAMAAIAGLRLTCQGATVDPAIVAITLTNGKDYAANP